MFRLTAKQIEARALLSGPASNVMLRGGSRSGKTFLIVRQIVQRGLNAPGSRHAIWRFRFNHVKASIWQETLPKVAKLCFPTVPLHTNESDLVATLPNDSQIVLGGLDDKARVEKVLGQEYATLYFNESSQIPWSSVETALSRLAQNVELDPAIAKATGRTHLALKAFFDCNPPSKLHWSYELFRAKLKPGTKEALPNPEDYAEMLVNPADNRENLPDKYFDILAGMSEAKRLRFERGEWATEVNGALWTLEQIDLLRLREAPPLKRIVVAIDPATTNNKGSDESGIIVAGLGADNRSYILQDASMRGSPDEVCLKAVKLYRAWQADRIVAEVNNGGDWIESLLRTVDSSVPYRKVSASRSKAVRAEPASSLYEQGRVHHVGSFPELEDQMCAFTIDFDRKSQGYSPDRVDALVWALAELYSSTGLSFATV